MPPSLSRDVYCPGSVADARQAYNDALALESRGQVDAARQLYLKAIELDPNYCDAMDNLGLILRRQNKLDEAASWYKRSIQIYSNNPVARTNLAVVYRLQGKLDDAIAEYRRVTEIAPEDAEGYFGLGSLYVVKEQPQQAIPPLLQAEALYAASSSPLITDARYYLGVAYTMSRQYASGRDYLETIYAEMSDNGLVNYYLGLCYFSPELNDRERAVKYFKRAQELGINLPAEIRQLLANSTPTPTATRPPASAQPTLTPASKGFAIPTGKPIAVWKGIPIMPQALAGDDGGDGYTFTVNATVAEARAFYEQAMPAAGWSPFAAGTGQDNTVRMMMYRGQGITTSVLIFDQAGVTFVVIVQT